MAAETDRAMVGDGRALQKRRSLHADAAQAEPKSIASSAGWVVVALGRFVAARPLPHAVERHGWVRTRVRARGPEGLPESWDRRRAIPAADRRPLLNRYAGNCMALRGEHELKWHMVSWFNAFCCKFSGVKALLG